MLVDARSYKREMSTVSEAQATAVSAPVWPLGCGGRLADPLARACGTHPITRALAAAKLFIRKDTLGVQLQASAARTAVDAEHFPDVLWDAAIPDPLWMRSSSETSPGPRRPGPLRARSEQVTRPHHRPYALPRRDRRSAARSSRRDSRTMMLRLRDDNAELTTDRVETRGSCDHLARVGRTAPADPLSIRNPTCRRLRREPSGLPLPRNLSACRSAPTHPFAAVFRPL